MTPPIWLDAAGRPRPTQACWTCGREVAPMRFRAERSAPPGLGAAADVADSGLVRLLDGVPARAHGRRLVVPRADLGAGADAKPAAPLGARRALLGGRPGPQP